MSFPRKRESGNVDKITLILILFSFIDISAQTDTSSVFVLPQMKIVQKEKKENVTYNFDEDRNMFLVTDSFLVANLDKYDYKVSFFDLKKISVRNGTSFWGGAKVGAAAGFVVGTLFAVGLKYSTCGGHGISFCDMPFSAILAAGIIVAVPFALIGGAIGAVTPYFEIYNISGRNLDKKKSEVINILKKNKLKR